MERKGFQIKNCSDRRKARVEPELGFLGNCRDGSTTEFHRPIFEISEIDGKKILTCMNSDCPFSGVSPSSPVDVVEYHTGSKDDGTLTVVKSEVLYP